MTFPKNSNGQPCRFAKTCGERMAFGDREYGCIRIDERTCGVAADLKEMVPPAPWSPCVARITTEASE